MEHQVHYHVHKNLSRLLQPRLIHSSPVRTSYFFEIHFNNILPSTPRSSRQSLPISFFFNALYTFLITRVRVTYPAHPFNRIPISFDEYLKWWSDAKVDCGNELLICYLNKAQTREECNHAFHNHSNESSFQLRCVQWTTSTFQSPRGSLPELQFS